MFTRIAIVARHPETLAARAAILFPLATIDYRKSVVAFGEKDSVRFNDGLCPMSTINAQARAAEAILGCGRIAANEE